MVEQLELTYSCGIHARPSLALVELVKPFDAQVFVKNVKGNRTKVDSVLNVLSLGIQAGMVEFETTGKQAEEAMEAIRKFITMLNTDHFWQ